METKYQTAYCDTLDAFLSAIEVHVLENKADSFYSERFAKHLWCPECKKKSKTKRLPLNSE